MFDFIALGIIAEFDDYFLEIYKGGSNLEPLIDVTFTFENTIKPKRNLPNVREVKLEKALGKIR